MTRARAKCKRVWSGEAEEDAEADAEADAIEAARAAARRTEELIATVRAQALEARADADAHFERARSSLAACETRLRAAIDAAEFERVAYLEDIAVKIDEDLELFGRDPAAARRSHVACFAGVPAERGSLACALQLLASKAKDETEVERATSATIRALETPSDSLLRVLRRAELAWEADKFRFHLEFCSGSASEKYEVSHLLCAPVCPVRCFAVVCANDTKLSVDTLVSLTSVASFDDAEKGVWTETVPLRRLLAPSPYRVDFECDGAFTRLKRAAARAREHMSCTPVAFEAHFAAHLAAHLVVAVHVDTRCCSWTRGMRLNDAALLLITHGS
jgi:hypothetical protein